MKRVSALVVVMVLSLGAVLLLPPSRLPAGEKMDMEKMISSAKTAADYEALAAEYETQAAGAKAQAAEHRKMAESYKKVGGAALEKLHLDQHCERLAKSYENAAMEYEALAKAEREMAKAAK